MLGYRKMLDKTAPVNAVSGFIGNDSVDTRCLRLRKRIVASMESSVKRWNDDWCDPYWEVRLAEPHPDSADAGSMWISGICRHLNSMQADMSDVLSIEDTDTNAISCIIHAEHGNAGECSVDAHACTRRNAGRCDRRNGRELAKRHTAFVDFELDGVRSGCVGATTTRWCPASMRCVSNAGNCWSASSATPVST